MKKVMPMLQAFKEYEPTFSGPITPQQSVEYVLKLMRRATIEEFGGAFVSHFGNEKWL